MALYISHFEAMQNVVRLHKATSNATLEEVSTLASSNSISTKEVRNGSFDFSFWCIWIAVHITIIDLFLIWIPSIFLSFLQFLDAEAVEANSMFDELQSTLSTHQGEMAHFARELRQVSIWTLVVNLIHNQHSLHPALSSKSYPRI